MGLYDVILFCFDVVFDEGTHSTEMSS